MAVVAKSVTVEVGGWRLMGLLGVCWQGCCNKRSQDALVETSVETDVAVVVLRRAVARVYRLAV